MYARQFGEEVLTFGVSGKLTLSAMIMYDHQTDSLWTHFTGEAITGEYQGTQLEVLPAMQTTWGHWRELHPDSQVLAWRMPTTEDPTGALGFTYDPYLGYYASGWSGYGRVREDDRLDQKDFVLGLVVNDKSMAYAFNDLVDHPVVNDTVGGRDLVVTYEPVVGHGDSLRPRGGRTLPDLQPPGGGQLRRPAHGGPGDEQPVAASDGGGH